MNLYIYGWEHIICWNFETWGSCLYISVSAHSHTPTSNNNKKILYNDTHMYIHNRALAIYINLGMRPSREIVIWHPPGDTLLWRAPYPQKCFVEHKYIYWGDIPTTCFQILDTRMATYSKVCSSYKIKLIHVFPSEKSSNVISRVKWKQNHTPQIDT